MMQLAYPEWLRLEALIEKITSQGITQLPPDEILEFGRLYRQAAAELAFQRAQATDRDRLRYLNDLLGRCYPHVYSAPRHPWPSLRLFFQADFPRAFRRHFHWTLLAFLISMLPGFIGFAVAWHDRAVADQVLSHELLVSSERVAERHDRAHDWMPADTRPAESSFIMTNNVRVTILTFAGGMTAGLLTLFLLGYNGFMLGICAAIVGLHGGKTALNFWAFVAPHGVFELTAIFISGGAGLLLAYAMLNPGEVPRRIALQDAGKESIKLMLGVAAMLVIAGLLEGFFSPLNISEYIKYSVAVIEAVALGCYLLFAGRRLQDERTEHTNRLMIPLPPL